MVQVFAPSPAAMQRSQLGQAIGIGINKNFPDPQQLVQKNLLSQAFQKFKQNTNPNASPLDLTMSFLEATAGIPGSERYVGQVLPLLIQQSKGERGAALGSPSGDIAQQPDQNILQGQPQVSPSQPVNATQFLQQTTQQIPNFPQPDTEQPNLFQGTLEPTSFGMGPLPNTYSPEQIQQLEREDLQAGFPDAPRARRAEQYNELARKQNRDYIDAAQTQSLISEAAANRQEKFRGTLKSFVGDNPDDLALAESIAENKYRNIANDQLRAEKVSREYDLLKGNLNEFRNSSSRPNPYLPISKQKYDKNFDNLRTNAQPLIEMGLRPQLNKILADNGWSMTETDQILNPLGEKIINEIKGLPSLERKPFLGEEFSLFPEGKKYVDKMFGKDNLSKEKIWSDYFQKTIKPGQENPKTRETLKPGTSLFLLQNQFMKKNGNYLDFQKIINNLVNTGKIKLDKYQQKEMNTLNNYPIQNYTLEEFFFGTKNL